MYLFLPAPAVIDIDSVSTFTMCHEALKYLKKEGYGRNSSRGGSILNISATLHYTASWYQIHVIAAKVCHINFFLRCLCIQGFTLHLCLFLEFHYVRQPLIALLETWHLSGELIMIFKSMVSPQVLFVILLA